MNELDDYLRVIGAAHDVWAARNAAPRFAPGEHPDRSDYNVETLDVEATGEQLDELDRITRQMLTEAGLIHLHPAPLV